MYENDLWSEENTVLTQGRAWGHLQTWQPLFGNAVQLLLEPHKIVSMPKHFKILFAPEAIENVQ